MYIDSFDIKKIDMKLGAAFSKCNYDNMSDELKALMENACNDVIKIASPKAVFEVFDIDSICEENEKVSFADTEFVLTGKSICKHLKGSKKAVFMAATLGTDVDRLIKKETVSKLEYAVFLDGLAGALVEMVCDETEKIISDTYNPESMTYRFGLGYGDLSIEYEEEFLRLIKAGSYLGLCVTESNLLIPCKSVACIIGLRY